MAVLWEYPGARHLVFMLVSGLASPVPSDTPGPGNMDEMGHQAMFLPMSTSRINNSIHFLAIYIKVLNQGVASPPDSLEVLTS